MYDITLVAFYSYSRWSRQTLAILHVHPDKPSLKGGPTLLLLELVGVDVRKVGLHLAHVLLQVREVALTNRAGVREGRLLLSLERRGVHSSSECGLWLLLASEALPRGLGRLGRLCFSLQAR